MLALAESKAATISVLPASAAVIKGVHCCYKTNYENTV